MKALCKCGHLIAAHAGPRSIFKLGACESSTCSCRKPRPRLVPDPPASSTRPREQPRPGIVSSRSAATIVALVVGVTGISLQALRGRSRTKAIVHARHVAMFLIRRHTRSSLPEIGALFGDRDHTTVMSALAKIEHQRNTLREVAEHIRDLEARLGIVTEERVAS